MKPFKFFQKGTLDDQHIIELGTRATASFNDRNQQYFTEQAELYNRLRNIEGERYYYDRQLGRFETVRPTLNQEEVIRRINGGQPTGVIHNDNHGNTDYVPFFINGSYKVTRPKPNWWQRFVKKLNDVWFFRDVEGVITFAILLTTATIMIISKLLNIW